LRLRGDIHRSAHLGILNQPLCLLNRELQGRVDVTGCEDVRTPSQSFFASCDRSSHPDSVFYFFSSPHHPFDDLGGILHTGIVAMNVTNLIGNPLIMGHDRPTVERGLLFEMVRRDPDKTFHIIRPFPAPFPTVNVDDI
jgi:hypothetical protein